MTPQKANPEKPSKQLDKDPVPLIDFEKLNELYETCIGIKPINKADFPRLYDLTIIRHCIVHNGSIIREIDLPRFQFYNVTANQIINPTADFVKETCHFLYTTGRNFENTIRDKIFKKVIPSLNKDWVETKPKLILDLIFLFNFFGKIPTGDNLFSEDPEVIRKENENKLNELVNLCIQDLTKLYGE